MPASRTYGQVQIVVAVEVTPGKAGDVGGRTGHRNLRGRREAAAIVAQNHERAARSCQRQVKVTVTVGVAQCGRLRTGCERGGQREVGDRRAVKRNTQTRECVEQNIHLTARRAAQCAASHIANQRDLCAKAAGEEIGDAAQAELAVAAEIEAAGIAVDG